MPENPYLNPRSATILNAGSVCGRSRYACDNETTVCCCADGRAASSGRTPREKCGIRNSVCLKDFLESDHAANLVDTGAAYNWQNVHTAFAHTFQRIADRMIRVHIGVLSGGIRS